MPRNPKWEELGKSFWDPFWDGQGWPPFQWIFNMGVLGSQWLSVILGGDPDETISSRLGKAQRAGVWWAEKIACPLVDLLLFEENHCLKSIEDDEGMKEIWHWVKPTKGGKDAGSEGNAL